MTSEALNPSFVFFHDLHPVSHHVYFHPRAAQKQELKAVRKMLKAATNKDLKRLKLILILKFGAKIRMVGQKQSWQHRNFE